MPRFLSSQQDCQFISAECSGGRLSKAKVKELSKCNVQRTVDSVMTHIGDIRASVIAETICRTLTNSVLRKLWVITEYEVITMMCYDRVDCIFNTPCRCNLVSVEDHIVSRFLHHSCTLCNCGNLHGSPHPSSNFNQILTMTCLLYCVCLLCVWEALWLFLPVLPCCIEWY